MIKTGLIPRKTPVRLIRVNRNRINRYLGVFVSGFVPELEEIYAVK